MATIDDDYHYIWQNAGEKSLRCVALGFRNEESRGLTMDIQLSSKQHNSTKSMRLCVQGWGWACLDKMPFWTRFRFIVSRKNHINPAARREIDIWKQSIWSKRKTNQFMASGWPPQHLLTTQFMISWLSFSCVILNWELISFIVVRLIVDLRLKGDGMTIGNYFALKDFRFRK